MPDRSKSPDTADVRTVYGARVRGVAVGPETRCAHYHGPRDVIAIRFACCGDWFPCHACHAARADHDAAVWPREAWDTEAVLCGACGHRLPIRTYLQRADDGMHACPACDAPFNPGCARHHDRYFAAR